MAHPNSWFQQGHEALHRVLPELPPGYLCPLCLKLFGLEHISQLSRDHAPSKSRGGRYLVLTCGTCNSESGFTLEDEMSKRETLIDLVRGEMTTPIEGRLEINGINVNVEIMATGKVIRLIGIPEQNRPEIIMALQQELERLTAEGLWPQQVFKLEFRPSYDERLAAVGRLRAAYLIAFAALGYSYILQPALQVVRNQLAAPEQMLIRRFSVTVDKSVEQAIMLVREPAWLHGLAIQFDRHVVFLPWDNDIGIYDRLAGAPGDRLETSVEGGSIPWPNRPQYALDGGGPRILG